jgi:hypothetical protein
MGKCSVSGNVEIINEIVSVGFVCVQIAQPATFVYCQVVNNIYIYIYMYINQLFGDESQYGFSVRETHPSVEI